MNKIYKIQFASFNSFFRHIKYVKKVIAFLSITFFVSYITVWGQTTSTRNAGTGTNVADTGSVAWVNPDNVISNNNLYSTIALNNQTSNSLQATNYGFTIPFNAIITGIRVTIGRYQSAVGSGNDIHDIEVMLLKGGSTVGNNYALAAEWPTAEGTVNYGSQTDIWGTTWTPAQINAVDFGVSLVANSTNNRTGRVDYMLIAVTYVLPNTFASFSLTANGTFSVPSNVSCIKVEAWGGGGAGGAARGNPSAGGGGGGGGYASSILTGLDNSYPVTVGAAKAGTSTSVINNGNPSYFGLLASPQVYASGGSGGVYVTANYSNGAGGSGGTDNIGSTIYNGGDGAAGIYTPTSTPGGAGGGGAGSTGPGNYAVAGEGGAATLVNGGIGADGVAAGATGTAGGVYGGGGSGGKANSSTNRAGGAGAQGLVIVSFIILSPPPEIIGNTQPCVGSTETYSVSNIVGVTYTWSFPADWIITGGQGTNSVTVEVGDIDGNVQVTPFGYCSGEPGLLAVASGVALQPDTINGPITVCQNSTWNYNVPNIPGETYTWTVPAGSTINSGQGTNSVNITFSTTSGTITVTPSNICGVGTAQTLAINIQNSAPAMPSIITGPSSACQGSTQIYSVVNDPSVSLYNWSLPSDWAITAGLHTNSITVTVGATSGDISVTATNTCATGNARTKAVISIATTPDQPVLVNGDTVLCLLFPDQYFTIVDTLYSDYQYNPHYLNTVYTWSIPGDWSLLSGQGTNQIHVGLGASSGNVIVTPSNSCGNGIPLSLTVTVDDIVPSQPVSITGNINPCEASTQTYSVTNQAEVYFNWTLPSDWTIVSGQGSNSIVVIIGHTSGTVDVIASNACGSAMDQTLDVTVSPLPNNPGTITGDTIFCQGTSTTYGVSSVSGVSFFWEVPTGWIITSGQGTNLITVTIGANSGNVQVTPVNSCGSGVPSVLNVHINPSPAAETGPDNNICVGASIHIGAAGVPGNTYCWTSIPAGFVSSDPNPLVQPDTTTMYYLVETVTATGCTNTDSVLVVSNQIIIISITPPTENMCTGETTNVAMSSNQSGTTFSWTADLTSGTATTGFSNGTGNNISQTINNTSDNFSLVTYSITAHSNDCINDAILEVTINPAPVVTSQTVTVCSDFSTALTFGASTNGVAVETYNITNINSNGLTAFAGNPVTGSGFSNNVIADDAWINTTANPVNVIYTVAPVSAIGCVGVSFTVTVTVKPKPVITNSSTKSICSETGTNINLTATIASTFSWTIGTITGSITGASEGSGATINQVLTNPSNAAAGTVQYIITPISSSGSCSGNAFTITVTVNPLPIVTNLSTKTICSGSGTDISLSASANSTFAWSLGAITGGITGASAGSGTAINQVLTAPTSYASGTVPYIITPTSTDGLCIGTVKTITVTVNPIPLVTASASVSSVCPGINFNLFSSSNVDFPPVLLNENFNGSNSWVTSNSSSGGTPANAAWTIRPDAYSSNSQTFHSNDNSQFFISNSYLQNGTITSTTLTSNAISTIGYNSLTLDFWHYYDYNARTNEAAKVQVSTNGTVWNDIVTYNSDQGSVSNFAHTSINLDAYIGNATLYVRFFYYCGSNRGRYWAIDNVNLSGTSTASDPSISWTSNPASFTSTVANPVNVSHTVTTDYIATYTIAATGCSNSDTVTVTAYPAPVPTIISDYCSVPGHIQLVGGGGETYLWNTGETTQAIAIDIAGIYSVTVTNAFGCWAAEFVDASNEMVIDGSFTDFDPAYPSFYTGYIQQQSYYEPWAPNPELTGLWPEGYYAVNTSAWYNPVDSTGYHTNFHGRDHTLNTVGPRNFLMINGATQDVPLKTIWEQTVSVAPNIDYYFSAWAMNLNPASCARLQFEVNGTLVGTIADLDIAPKPTTEGQVGLSNWVRFYSNPLWNSGSATTAVIRIVNLNTVAGGNDFGLDDISFGTLAPIPFTTNPSSGGTVCENDTLKLFANIIGGRAPITYSWTGPNGFTSNQKDPTIPNATVANSGTYSLTVVDGYGCDPVTMTTVAVVNPLPTASINGTTTVCQLALDPDITFTGSNGTSPYNFTYQINGGAYQFISTTSGNSVSIPASTLIPGTYTYSLISVSDANGCNNIQGGSATVTVNSLPSVGINGDNPVCAGLTGVPYSATSGFDTYSWVISGEGTITGPTNTNIIHVNVGPSYGTSFTLTLNVTSSYGCNGINEVEIFIDDTTKPFLIVPPSPQDRNVDPNTCSYTTIGNEFNPISFNDNCEVATVVNDLNWTNSLAGYVFPLGITQVTWIVTDLRGNSSKDSIYIRIRDNQPPIISCPSPYVVCANSDHTYINSTNMLDAGATDNCTLDGIAYNLSGATSGTGSTLENVTFGTGITTVTWRATDASGNFTTCLSSVTVQTEPIISVQPQGIILCPSAAQAIFNVVNTLSPSPIYQWRKNGTDISGANTDTYIINNPQQSDNGVYDVVITNSCGTTTSISAYLFVYGLPFAMIDTTTIYESIGYDPDPISLIFSKAGGATPLSFQWQLNDTDILNETGILYDSPPLMNTGVYPFNTKICDSCGTVFYTQYKEIIIQSPLPIELINFTANCSDGNVYLNWATSTETNNDYFTVQRSLDAHNFVDVITIPGAGNNNSPLHYQAIDENVYAGISYYRLKQTDFNGVSEIFKPVPVVCLSDENTDINIYPNPFLDEIVIKHSRVINDISEISLFDMQGILIMQKVYSNSNSDSYTIDLRGIACGLYYIKFVSGNEIYFQKIIKTSMN